MLKKLKNFCRLTRRSEGFTLVELVVVIAIVAILSGIAVPAYGAYVEKSQKAGDLQLLAAVNKAFAAACMENGLTVYEVKDEEGTPKIMSYEAPITVDVFPEEFTKFFAGNETSGFEVIDQLMFVKGVFVDPTTNPEGVVEVSYGGGSIYISEEDIAELNSSAFGEMGIKTLLDKVDFATQVAISSTDPRMQELVNGQANLNSLARALGFSSGNDPEFQAAYMELVNEKAKLMAGEGGNYEDYISQAAIAINANSAVLTAATKSFDTDDFTTKLGSGDGKDIIKANINNDPQTALAQAAFAYAMYTSYTNSKGIPASEEMNLDEVLSTLDTKEFQEYIKEDKDGKVTADIKGYQSAMNMISSSSNDSDAVSNLLVNGFNDPDLLKVLQHAMG